MSTSEFTSAELSETSPAAPEAMLSELEARILGALMEKQLTTPDAYPLTLNSLVLACNQKTSREPVTHLQSGEVQRCVSELQDRKLIEVDYGTRAARYDQRLTRVLSVDKATQALLNIMLLRGPQTLAELLTRTQRMFEFSGLAAVEDKVEQLCAKTHPLVRRIPRQAGQREDRYTHLLCGEPDITVIAVPSGVKRGASELDERVLQLEAKVTTLEGQLQKLMTLTGVSAEDLAEE